MKSNGIISSAPYHPASNGAVERLVQTFKKAMKERLVQTFKKAMKAAKKCGKYL